MKIAVYTITKNEEKFIERWANSCIDADYRLIVDTGSTDHTVDKAIACGCSVSSITISPWRFDDARNAALALLPDDVDFCVSLDADEILLPGWRQHLESLPNNVTRPRYKYVWSWNADGSEGLTFYRDHIHRRHGYRWKHPVHEILVPTGEEIQAICGLEVHHHPDPTKSRSQYLPLLELAVREDPTGDRNMFYLGRELMYVGRNKEAAKFLAQHLKISTWDAERSASMRYLARVTDDTEQWLLRSAGEAPNRREPWFDLAEYYYKKWSWQQCLACAERALSIDTKPLDYICEPASWGHQPHDYAAIAAWNMGQYDRAFAHSNCALEITPMDPRLISNCASIVKSMRKNFVDVVIPTKSNVDGLLRILKTLKLDNSVRQIFVVADGIDSRDRLTEMNLGVKILGVSLGSGIHAMWNRGLEQVHPKAHVMFLNDDVQIQADAVSILAGTLDIIPNIGLISPNYDNRHIKGHGLSVEGATGVYGKTGVSGAAMMLRNEHTQVWRFDERMKWYFGDDDIARTVKSKYYQELFISNLCKSWDNESWTIQNDPPENFDELIIKDKEIFDQKWPADAR